MFPRVALEYGHTWWAALTISTACSGSPIEGSVTSRVTATVYVRSSPGMRLTLGVDGRVAEVDLDAPADRAEGALEAGGVADREELLGIGAVALAAHLLGASQVDLEHAVVGPAVAGHAAADDVGAGGVDRLSRHAPDPTDRLRPSS